MLLRCFPFQSFLLRSPAFFKEPSALPTCFVPTFSGMSARRLTSQPLIWPKLFLRSFLGSCSAVSEVLASKAASATDTFVHTWSGLFKGHSLPAIWCLAFRNSFTRTWINHGLIVLQNFEQKPSIHIWVWEVAMSNLSSHSFCKAAFFKPTDKTFFPIPWVRMAAGGCRAHANRKRAGLQK